LDTNNSIYISYSLLDYRFVLPFANDLYVSGIPVCFDRFAISPVDNWADGVRGCIKTASQVIAIISQSYLESSYCQYEVQYFTTNQIPIYAIFIEDVAIQKMQGAVQHIDWFDFTQHRIKGSYQTSLEKFISKVFADNTRSPKPSAEAQYLINAICTTELFLFNTPFQQVFLRSHHAKNSNLDVRPSCHFAKQFLVNGFYTLRMNGDTSQETNELTITSLIDWLNVRTQLVLSGEAGCGKTLIARHLFLLALHNRVQSGTSQPLPLWISAAGWHSASSLEVIFQSILPVASNDTPLIVFIDEIDRLSSWQLDEVLLWLNRTDSTLVATARYTDHLRLSLANLSVPPLPNMVLERLSKSYLPQHDAETFVAAVLQNSTVGHNPAIYKRMDFVGWQMLLSQISSDAPTPQHPGDIISRIVPALWAEADSNKLGRFSLQRLESALGLLAFKMVNENGDDYLTHAEILGSLGNHELIQITLFLGILDEVQGNFRFRHKAMHNYYAAVTLLHDGIYTRLTYPEFDDNGNYQLTHWDEVIQMLLCSQALPAAIANLETIAEVNPFLAANLLTYIPTTPDYIQQDIIHKLLDAQRTTQYPANAIRNVLIQLRNPMLIDRTLVECQSKGDWATRQQAFLLLLEQSIDITDSIIEQVEQIDRTFPDSALDMLEGYDRTDLLGIFIMLTTHSRVRIRRNTIWILSQLQDKAAVPALTTAIEDENQSVVVEAIRGLGQIGDKAALPSVLQLSNHPEADIFAEVRQSLIKLQRPVTAYFIELLRFSETSITSDLIKILASIRDEVLEAIIIEVLIDDSRAAFSSNISLPKIRSEEDDTVKQLLDFISNHMQTLRNHEAFNDFVDTLANRQSTPSNVEAQNLKHLKDRIRGGNPRQHVAASQHTDTRAENNPQAPLIPQRIVQELQDTEWEVRLQAIAQLAHYDASKTLPYLLEASHDTDYQIRVAALEALGKLKDFPIALDALVKALDDDDYLVLDALIEILKKCGSGILYNVLEKLNSSKVNTLAVVIEVLGAIGNDTIVPRLAAFLSDTRAPWVSERTLRDIAAQALLDIGTPLSIQAVHDAGYVEKSVSETIILPDSEAAPARPRQQQRFTPIQKIVLALKALRGDDWQQSQKAARYIREYAKRLRGNTELDVIKPLQEALIDENWVVRWTVVEALAWLKNPSTEEHLIPLLSDTNWIVRVAVIRALVELDAYHSAVSIAHLIQDSQNAVREAVVEAVGILNNPDVLPTLKKAVDDDDAFVRLAAIQSITTLADEEAIPFIIHKLSDSSSHVRWATIQHLAKYPEQVSIEYFAIALNDCEGPEWETKTISDYAVEALQKVDSAASKALLETWKKSE
jgi:HEAT repeat protein